MKVTRVTCEPFEVLPPAPFHWRDGLPGSGASSWHAWVRVETDDGVTGEALLTHGGRIMADLVDRRLGDLLTGTDPLMKESAWKQVWEIDRIEELPIYATAALDLALWDITAKVAGLPLYQVIGGYRDRIPAYASTVTFDTIEEFLAVADACLAHGFRAIKLHAWGDARRDARLCEALRAHVGPDVALMYDGSAGFDLVDAIYLGRALREAGYAWYEEPMREFSIAAHRMLADALPGLPLLWGETSDGAHWNIADFIVSGGATMVRTSTHFKGGITGGLRIAHLADAFHMRAEVHGGGAANLHLACAIPNTTWYESLVFSTDVVVEAGIGRDGCISPAAVPGIGWGLTG